MQPLVQWKNNKYYLLWVCVCVCVCVLPLLSDMQCACATLSSMACPTLQYFSTLSYKRQDLKKKKKLPKTKCVFWFSLQFLSETFLILRRTERDMIKNVYWSSRKVHVVLVRFQFEFSRQFFEKYPNIKFHENPFGGSRVVPCGRTNMTKLFAILRTGLIRWIASVYLLHSYKYVLGLLKGTLRLRK
jgi:hypothetical protein